MFTGIIEECGVINAAATKSNLCTISLKVGKAFQRAKLGESVAVDGVCLTVTKVKGQALVFDVMKETLEKTTIGCLKAGDRVNLEKALAVGGTLDGHFVTGHVDGLGKIARIVRDENYVEFQVKAPVVLRKFIVTKGSICLNGISLTVGKVRGDLFSVYMIPFTMQVTTMSDKKTGDLVNLEADILARYILGRKRS